MAAAGSRRVRRLADDHGRATSGTAPGMLDGTPVGRLELEPVVGAHAGPVGRVGPLGDHPFEPERGARLHHVVDGLVERPDRRPRRPGQRKPFEELAPPGARQCGHRPVVEPQDVEGDEREAPSVGEEHGS
jgi:hypothetical protein